MPKKLTLLGVLAALTIGAIGLFSGSGTTYAGPGGPLQNFAVNADTCWGTAPVDFTPGPPCSGTTNTLVADTGISTSYATALVSYGGRLTLPVTYTPTALLSAEPADGTNTGDVTARVDLFCNGGADSASDILANDTSAAGVIGTYPVSWVGEEIELTDPYRPELDDVKPYPFAITRVDEASLERLWANGVTSVSITASAGQRTPLSVVQAVSSYQGTLSVSYAQLGGQPSAPTSTTLCLDAPQDSSTRLTGLTLPAGNAMYTRWTMYPSALDLRTRDSFSILVDLQCVTVGAAIADDDGDCLPNGPDLDDLDADQDNDGLVDGIETAAGSSLTSADADGDLANDFLEMAQFTDDADSDTDDDGQLDFPELGADETTASKSTIEDTAADDNCPNTPNGDGTPASPASDWAAAGAEDGQLNSDSPRYAPTFQPVGSDSSDPDQDNSGDACDDDDDSDAAGDVAEFNMYLQTSGTGTVIATDPDDANHCGDINKTSAGDGSDPTPDDDFTAQPTDVKDADTDDDGGLDGRECQMGASGTGPRYSGTPRLSGPALTADEEKEYRTTEANHRTIAASGAVETDCDDMLDDDGDSVADDGCADGGELLESEDFDGDGSIGTADVDSDADGMLDGNEVKFYGTLPSSDDTDGDDCKDGTETADVPSFTVPNTAPSNRAVTVIDLGQVAAASAANAGNIRTIVGAYGTGLDQTRVNFDWDKNGTINVLDLGQVAARSGNCGGGGSPLHQGGLTIIMESDGVAD